MWDETPITLPPVELAELDRLDMLEPLMLVMLMLPVLLPVAATADVEELAAQVAAVGRLVTPAGVQMLCAYLIVAMRPSVI